MQNFLWVEFPLLGAIHVPGKIAMEYLECRIQLLIQYQQCPCPVTNMQGHAVTMTVWFSDYLMKIHTIPKATVATRHLRMHAGCGLEPILYHPFGVLCQGSMEHADRLLTISRP